jgi:hypothetical protein
MGLGDLFECVGEIESLGVECALVQGDGATVSVGYCIAQEAVEWGQSRSCTDQEKWAVRFFGEIETFSVWALELYGGFGVCVIA